MNVVSVLKVFINSENKKKKESKTHHKLVKKFFERKEDKLLRLDGFERKIIKTPIGK